MKTYKSNTLLNRIRKSGVVGTELVRNIDTMEDRERREFINSRGLIHMDRRCKIGMCAFGNCRIEFYLKGESGAGSRKYCKPHSKEMMLVRQRNYNKDIKWAIKARNAAWHKQRPGYAAEYYQKNKAKNQAYAQKKRDDNKKEIKQ
jgi:hypothetical protein